MSKTAKDIAEDRKKLARRVKDSIENYLTETGIFKEDHPASLYFDIEMRGESVLWEFGDYSGRVNVIGNCEGSAVLLDYEKIIYGDSRSKRYYISSIELALKIQKGIGDYLEKYGKCYLEDNGKKSYNLKKIP